MIHPRVTALPMPHPDMPASASELYVEASDVFPSSRRASAALARAALERLLRELEAGGETKRLDELVAGLSGRIREPLWMLLTALRIVGNDALHGGDGPLVILYLDQEEADMAELLFGAINALVEELITQPAKAAELYEMLPPGKRSEAERKAKASRDER